MHSIAFLPGAPLQGLSSPHSLTVGWRSQSCSTHHSHSCHSNSSARPPALITALASENGRSWGKVAIGVAGLALGCAFPSFGTSKRCLEQRCVVQPVVAAEKFGVGVTDGSSSVPLSALGIRQEDYVSHRELARRKTTVYSEAEEEIMELEEDEVESQWFRDLRMTYAGVASIGGIMVLYKGGVLWEGWIQEQERKDIEEEIELTGTFIDPRADRKEEDDEKKKKNGGAGENPGTAGPSGKGGSGPGSSGSQSPPDDLPGGIDALERLFGKS